MKRLIYHTGACPRCGSILTARLMQGPSRLQKFYPFGPVVYDAEPGDYNIICTSCGVRWAGGTPLRLIPQEEFRELKEEWKANAEGRPSKKEQEEELRELASECGLLVETPGRKGKKKRKKGSGTAGKVARKLLLEPILSPIGAIRDFASDVNDMTEGRKRRRNAEEDEAAAEEQIRERNERELEYSDEEEDEYYEYED